LEDKREKQAGKFGDASTPLRSPPDYIKPLEANDFINLIELLDHSMNS
jgi:hypothetical protein